MVPWIWMASALAVPDSHPTVRAVSAAPVQDVSLDVGGGVSGGGLPFGNSGVAAGATARGSVRLSERFHLDGAVLVGRLTVCNPRIPCRQRDELQGSVRLGAALIARQRFRLVLYGGGGTNLEAGLSVWASSKNQRLAFDASVGGGVGIYELLGLGPRSWAEAKNPGPDVVVDLVSSVPEAGVTWAADPEHQSLRLGLYGFVPTVSYRVGLRHFKAELTVGTLGFVGLATGSLSGQF